MVAPGPIDLVAVGAPAVGTVVSRQCRVQPSFLPLQIELQNAAAIFQIGQIAIVFQIVGLLVAIIIIWSGRGENSSYIFSIKND